MRVEFHSHTILSKGVKVKYDGVDKPEEIVKSAKQKGLDAIVITDHNEIRGAVSGKKVAHGIKVIIGEEISTINGHLIGVGLNKRIPPGFGVEETIEMIHDAGGVAIAPHPFDIKDQGIKLKAGLCDAIEVFNSISMERVSNIHALSFGKKIKLSMVGGSDAHTKEMVGNVINIIEGSTEDDIVEAIRKGRVKIIPKYASIDQIIDWAIKRLKISYQPTIEYIKKNYSLPKRVISLELIKLINHKPRKLDYFIKPFGYISLGSTVMYAMIKSIFSSL